MRVVILGVSVWGPGLEGWTAAAPVLAGRVPRAAGETAPPAPALLAANERRRAGLTTRLALAVAAEAVAMAGLAADALPAVFASASGDGAVIHALLEALATPEGEVSPTRFHNSVHNASAGYWSIGTGSQQETDCLGAHDETAAAALLAAVTTVLAEETPVLLVLADAPFPPPLAAARPIIAAFAAALVLAPVGGFDRGRAEIGVGFSADAIGPQAERTDHPALTALARGTPAARLLPLLDSLAAGRADRFTLALSGGHLAVTSSPCSTATPSPI